MTPVNALLSWTRLQTQGLQIWFLYLWNLITGSVVLVAVPTSWRSGLVTDTGKSAICSHIGAQVWISTKHSLAKSNPFAPLFAPGPSCLTADLTELTTTAFPNAFVFHRHSSPSVTVGDVLTYVGWRKGQFHLGKLVVADASISPLLAYATPNSYPPRNGDSGGPVFSADGDMVGIVKGSSGFAFEVERANC